MSHPSYCLSVEEGCPKTSRSSFSLAIRVGSSTGPLAKEATIAPVLSVEVCTLPRVRSTSLTTIPGDAKFTGICLFSLVKVRNNLEIFRENYISNYKYSHIWLISPYSSVCHTSPLLSTKVPSSVPSEKKPNGDISCSI